MYLADADKISEVYKNCQRENIFVHVCTIKTYSRSKTMVPLILTSALVGGEGSDSSRGRSFPEKKIQYSFNKRLLEPRAGLNILDKRKFSCLYWVRTQDHPALIKFEVISIQAWRGPEGSRRLRLPGFMTIGS
jgi:hypothetical protein